VTALLYRDDPYLLEFDAAVVARRAHDGRPAVVLDRTAFYAESGGQPSDTGTLGGVPVVAVLHAGDDVVHVLERPLEGDRVTGRVDGARRRDHRQQHHGQHLLSRAFHDTAAARTVSFHLGARVSTIDLDRAVSPAEVAAAERRANEVVQEARPVAVRVVSRAEAARLGVPPPEDAGDAVRLVHAEGFDLQPCGGTHPRNTAEVGAIVVLGHERYKGGSRVRFVCGMRALDEVRARGTALDAACAALSAAPENVAELARRAVDEKVAAERRARDLRDAMLEREAETLGAAGPFVGGVRLVVATFDGRGPEELRILAGHLAAVPGHVALLAARAGAQASLVFARSEDVSCDVVALLREAASRLGGRGGGRGTMAQGGGSSEGLDEALAAAVQSARAALGAPRP
jgi:alanyl-tRNA synthetase